MLNMSLAMSTMLHSNASFIHIPKTGGTTIEALLPRSRAVIHRAKQLKPVLPRPRASPWHLPPDVFERVFNETYARPTFCVVRNPHDRMRSCFAWTLSRTFHTPLEQLGDVFARGRFRVRWTEEFAHRMPQSWFVWADDGRVLCDCVISFDKLASAVHSLKKNVASVPVAPFRLPKSLYAMDAFLYESARASSTLCYHPMPLFS